MSQSIYIRLIWFHDGLGQVSSDRWLLTMYAEDGDFNDYCPFLRAGSFMGSI